MKVGPYEVPGFAVGNALDLLRALPDESVQCCVTSPPYWGLRSYGTPPAIWLSQEPGQPPCEVMGGEHEWGAEERGKRKDIKPPSESTSVSRMGMNDQQGFGPPSGGRFCTRCGAWRGELGLEPTPELYVAHLTEIFREVRRVLRGDGTCWLNLGDSYSSHPNQRKTTDKTGPKQATNAGSSSTPSRSAPGLKPKDLVMLPARAALALQADGWYLRKDIIWNKPNPMPESTTDRPTSSHEHIFLFAKSPRYYYDAAAIAEPVAEATLERLNQATFDQQTGGPKDYSHGTNPNRSARRALVNLKKRAQAPQLEDSPGSYHLTRNSRDVWTIATKPDRSAHFAVFPPEIPRRCISAGTKQGDLVLDPFVGSGTTCRVAEDLGRAWLGFDASAEYVEKYCRPRLAQRGLFGGAS